MLQFYNFKKLSLAVVLLLLSLSAFSQTVIKGTIKDEKGDPLPGVSIQVKEASQVGANTDNNGNFSIRSAPSHKTLVIRLLSYKTQEVLINGRETINIVLQEDRTALDEIIITGYQAVARKDLTGSISTVNVEDLQKANVRSFDEALAGRVPGVQVTSNDGKPGAGVTILIRGVGSLTQSSDPLYVIDGIPMVDPNNNAIDPNTIETLTILKDASATAIYGARGSNGVIVITTKRGAIGTPRISYTGSYGLSQAPEYIKLLNAFQYAQLQSQSAFNANTSQAIKDQANPWFRDGRILEDYRNSPSIDWQDEILRTGPSQMHSLSVSGGTDKTRFSITANATNEDGIVVASDYKRYQARTTLDQTVNKQLKLGLTAVYNNLKQTGAPTTGITGSSLFWNAYGLRPAEVAGLETNFEEELYDPTVPIADLRINPIMSVMNTVNNNIQNQINGTVYGEYALTKNLKFKSEASLNYRNIRSELFFGSKTQAGGERSANKVNGALGINQNTQTLLRNSLFFNKIFNKVHKVNFFGAFEVENIRWRNSRLAGTQLPNEGLGISGIDAGVIAPFPSTFTSTTSSSLISGLFQANYDYKGKYYFTGSIRADGSSRFRGNNRWGYFPSGGVKWKLSEESFMKGLKFISDANFRVTYGVTGNNSVGDYASYSTISYQNPLTMNNVLQPNSAVVTSLDNPDLKWESTAQFDIGADFSFFKNRLTFTAEYYDKKISDLLMSARLPATAGYSSAQKNIGKVGNKGFDFSLEADIIKNKNFSWSSNFNISFVRNRLISLTAPDESAYTSFITNFDNNYSAREAFIARVGGPLGEIYGFISEGLYQLSDFDRSPSGGYTLKSGIPINSATTTITQPGDPKFRDLDGNGIINDLDRAVIGRGYPIHFGGLSNNFKFKNFDLNIFIRWSYGAEVLNANRLWFEDGHGLLFRPGYNQFYTEAGRWSPDNQGATQPRVGAGFTGYSSQYVEDASFIRLATVNIGYNFPKEMLKRIKLSNLRVFVSGKNLYTLTNYKGYDPEVSTNSTPLTPGLDWSSYPRAIVVSGGINLQF
jgi:TonB-linked SusC/RagA family outer membrane protein